MSKEVFLIEGQKLGLTSRELKAAINNIERLVNRVVKETNHIKENLENGLSELIDMWKDRPSHVLHYKKNFRHQKRVANRRRM